MTDDQKTSCNEFLDAWLDGEITKEEVEAFLPSIARGDYRIPKVCGCPRCKDQVYYGEIVRAP